MNKKTDNVPLLVIAAGGTGGHMFPAQSLAEEMLAKGWRVKLSTDSRGARYTQGFPKEVQQEIVSAATTARGGITGKLMAPFKILKGVATAVSQMRQDRPTVVVGFGGYPSLPAISAAVILKIPRAVHEQNGVLGRVNKLFATRVDKVACSVWPTELPEGVNAIHTGNPVRAAVLEKAGAPYNVPSATGNLLLVMGGSQGASILSNIVPFAIAALPEKLRNNVKIYQQARDSDLDAVKAFYEKINIDAEVAPFFENVPSILAECQLVISRSGASSVADISVIGRPAIFIPLAAAIRDEQTANAKGLVEAGAALLIKESDFTPDRLAEDVRMILEDAPKAKRMAEAALSQSKPDAAVELSNLVLALASQEKG